MTAAARLVGFVVVLLLVFGGAALAGATIGPDPGAARDAGETRPTGDDHGASEMTADGGGDGHAAKVKAVRGLAVSDGGLTLELARRRAVRGEPSAVAFRIADRDGETIRDFDVEHAKRMHLIVVRRDLTGFQHLHPTQAADGGWTVPVTLPAAGTYRVFADFSVDGRAYTLADDLQVDGAVRTRPLPAPATTAETDGLRVTLEGGAGRARTESELGFTVTRAGQPVRIQPYLGAKGHLVALREGDLAFLHVHPDENRREFMATFPTAGRYRLFLQFQVEGRVHTAEFTQEVAR